MSKIIGFYDTNLFDEKKFKYNGFILDDRTKISHEELNKKREEEKCTKQKSHS